ncbi:hypothetical protein Nepgr_000081 [Nepenthes gracilis]|uniref:Uncharacterized protein n=1 Tax=Nepenthes gracilis TaxID=150966 RepID=A0AAD3P3B8_NEPGR|nr:hypothetical protein Nepgr_000081 [Nepenthes gracilis]
MAASCFSIDRKWQAAKYVAKKSHQDQEKLQCAAPSEANAAPLQVLLVHSPIVPPFCFCRKSSRFCKTGTRLVISNLDYRVSKEDIKVILLIRALFRLVLWFLEIPNAMLNFTFLDSGETE